MNTFTNIQDDFSYIQTLAGDSILINGVGNYRALINYLKGSKSRDEDLRTISTTTKIKRGDIITWDNEQWLIITEIAQKRFSFYKGIIQKINYNIKFIFEDGITRQYPTIIESKVFDTESNKFFSLPKGKIIVLLQDTIDSRLIKTGARFIKMDKVFKVVGDDRTDNGIIKLYCDLDTFNPNDDIENEIADGLAYSYSLTIANGDSISLNENDTLQLNISLKLNNTTVTDKAISYASNDDTIATVDNNGLVTATSAGECIITASMVDMPNINDTINIIVNEVAQDNFTYEIIGSDYVIKGKTQNYIANKYNDGVLVPDAQFDFTIINGTTPTSAYTLNIISDTECSITANEIVYNITLRATDKEDNSKYAELNNISLEGYF